MLKSVMRRTGAAVAGAAAISLATASIASAHHCYKVDWNDRAYAAVSSGTAWMSLSDLAGMVISEQIGLPQCAYVGDAVAADYMAAKGMTEEPLIHSKATTGGGAAHRGKTVKPFSYLNEADFVILDEALTEHVGACLAG